MRSFEISCGSIDTSSSPSSSPTAPTAAGEETVLVEWGPDDKRDNAAAFSPIDKKTFQGTPSIKVQAGRDFQGANGLSLRFGQRRGVLTR